MVILDLGSKRYIMLTATVVVVKLRQEDKFVSSVKSVSENHLRLKKAQSEAA